MPICEGLGVLLGILIGAKCFKKYTYERPRPEGEEKKEEEKEEDEKVEIYLDYPAIMSNLLKILKEKMSVSYKFKLAKTTRWVTFDKLPESQQYSWGSALVSDISKLDTDIYKRAIMGEDLAFLYNVWKCLNNGNSNQTAINRLVLPTSEKPSEEYLEKIFSKKGLLKKANGYEPTRSGIIRKSDIPPIKENGKWIVYFISDEAMQISTVMEIKVPKNTSVPIYHVRLDGDTVLVINDPEKFRYTVCDCCMVMKVRVADLVRGVTGSVKHCRTICMECAMMNPLSTRECECHGSQICSGNWHINYDSAPALETTGIHTPDSVHQKTQNTTRRKERVSPTGLQKFAICCPNCETLTHHSGGCNSLDCGGIARGRDCSNQMCITCGSNVIPCGCGLTTAYRERNQNPAHIRTNSRMYPIPGIAGTVITEFTPVAHITRSFPHAGKRLGELFGSILTLNDTLSIARGIFAGHDYTGVTVQEAVRDLETVDDMVVLAVACVFAMRYALNFTSDKLRAVTSGISADTIRRQVHAPWWDRFHYHFLPLPAEVAAAAPAPLD